MPVVHNKTLSKTTSQIVFTRNASREKFSVLMTSKCPCYSHSVTVFRMKLSNKNFENALKS